jgi:hypothetical protein
LPETELCSDLGYGRVGRHAVAQSALNHAHSAHQQISLRVKQMTGGFALIAWPATYGISGIMTFLVDQDGVVFQEDLGKDTAALAGAMTRFDPDIGWARVDVTDN